MTTVSPRPRATAGTAGDSVGDTSGGTRAETAGSPLAGGAGETSTRRAMLREMIRIRRFEEACVELYSASRIRGFVHLCIGQEAVAVGVVGALGPGDAVVATYREHGHALARGIPTGAVMAEMFGKVTGCSRGRGGSMHLFDVNRRFYGGNAIVAGGIPLAVGMALADHVTGSDAVTACLFGDGAFAEGEFHESANLAALWGLPVLLCCENNRYAMGTALAREHAQTDLATRAASYGMVAWSVDGMDAVAVREAAERAISLVRESGRPCFLELRTYRFRAHSMYDPDRYRSREEVQRWKASDPVTGLTSRLVAEGSLTTSEVEQWEREVAAEIEQAVADADAAPVEPVDDLTRFVTTPPSGRQP